MKITACRFEKPLLSQAHAADWRAYFATDEVLPHGFKGGSCFLRKEHDGWVALALEAEVVDGTRIWVDREIYTTGMVSRYDAVAVALPNIAKACERQVKERNEKRAKEIRDSYRELCSSNIDAWWAEQRWSIIERLKNTQVSRNLSAVDDIICEHLNAVESITLRAQADCIEALKSEGLCIPPENTVG